MLVDKPSTKPGTPKNDVVDKRKPQMVANPEKRFWLRKQLDFG